MDDRQSESSVRAVVKYAGAFVAWVIGAGFATGQEILQFFSSYGRLSYAAILLTLAFFVALGRIMLTTGYEHRNEENFSYCHYYCGRRLGTFYLWFVPASLVLLMPVLVAAAGSALSQYFGAARWLGSSLMALMVLAAYLVGFERFVKIVSLTGPVVIFFTLLVGTVTVVRDFGSFAAAGGCASVPAGMKAAPNWILSSLLYVPLTFCCGSAYYNALGKSAANYAAAKWGAVLGSAAVMAAIAIMNTAILLNAGDASSLAVPTLFLAKKLLYLLGAAFSAVLFLGVFSCCSAMMWTFCNRLPTAGTSKDKYAAAAVSAAAFLLGLLPFARLVGAVYPFIGFMGLPFIACVLWKGLKSLKSR
jgi:uncharacterized membrane protein YkvI